MEQVCVLKPVVAVADDSDQGFVANPELPEHPRELIWSPARCRGHGGGAFGKLAVALNPATGPLDLSSGVAPTVPDVGIVHSYLNAFHSRKRIDHACVGGVALPIVDGFPDRDRASPDRHATRAHTAEAADLEHTGSFPVGHSGAGLGEEVPDFWRRAPRNELSEGKEHRMRAYDGYDVGVAGVRAAGRASTLGTPVRAEGAGVDISNFRPASTASSFPRRLDALL
jgi:hypothetical protein